MSVEGPGPASGACAAWSLSRDARGDLLPPSKYPAHPPDASVHGSAEQHGEWRATRPGGKAAGGVAARSLPWLDRQDGTRALARPLASFCAPHAQFLSSRPLPLPR